MDELEGGDGDGGGWCGVVKVYGWLSIRGGCEILSFLVLRARGKYTRYEGEMC